MRTRSICGRRDQAQAMSPTMKKRPAGGADSAGGAGPAGAGYLGQPEIRLSRSSGSRHLLTSRPCRPTRSIILDCIYGSNDMITACSAEVQRTFGRYKDTAIG